MYVFEYVLYVCMHMESLQCERNSKLSCAMKLWTKQINVCVCVCVCVCVYVWVYCVRVFVTYEDTNLYNDMGMT